MSENNGHITKQDLKELEQRLIKLVTDLHNSTHEEIVAVRHNTAAMAARLDKIAAGSHYVAKLSEWSDKQDQLQAGLAERVEALEGRVRDLEQRNQ